ncbi:hypothetical protein A3D11_00435 [Candidatus Peribacteria bacterium RIFCSPHIGHO2_02_FULL_49_16]|nr:MAG: hypothetical protein A2880_02500 [Candidatus Peribacteria bacterium RIFCSPHIGHO2_01_FULL_49_38]OGJ59074.1 MAG: hypothetical protein A3D11_00435 [Candidatus Peribacteria bacterium RIFCSPHIGHO2_02_FULL_49_16]
MHKTTILAGLVRNGAILCIAFYTAVLAAQYARISFLAEVDTITICHVPSNNTMDIPFLALEEHMAHGDYLGSCEHEGKEKVTICHVSNHTTMDLPSPALEEHMAHGDYLGICTNVTPEEPVTTGTDIAQPSADTPGIHRGRGLGEHAAVIHRVFQNYGLHENAPYQYTFHHENIRPAAFVSAATSAEWTLKLHAACCSMFRYLKRLQTIRPSIRPGYIDWMTEQVATAVGEDPTPIKAALLGFAHTHPNASEFIRSITEEGCAANPYVSGVSATNLTREQIRQDAFRESKEHIHAEPAISSPLTIKPHNETGAKIAFTVMDDEHVFTDYGISHTKELHLLVVRDDLRHFSHIHPHRDTAGMWHVPFTPPAGGMYWIYADFVDKDGQGHTIKFERNYASDTGPYGTVKTNIRTKRLGELFITLMIEPYKEGSLFTYNIRDAYGNTPELQPYLGAMGHGILLSSEGDFVHTHPSPAGDTLIFHTPVPTKAFYRIFTQFQIADEIKTIDFDWQHTSE